MCNHLFFRAMRFRETHETAESSDAQITASISPVVLSWATNEKAPRTANFFGLLLMRLMRSTHFRHPRFVFAVHLGLSANMRDVVVEPV